MTSVVVIRQNRGQSVPTSFELVDVNLNKGSWGDDVYLWYEQPPTSDDCGPLHGGSGVGRCSLTLIVMPWHAQRPSCSIKRGVGLGVFDRRFLPALSDRYAIVPHTPACCVP